MEVIIISVCHWGRSLLTTLLITVHYILQTIRTKFRLNNNLY